MSRETHFNGSRVLGRSCESLLGICVGLLADTRLNEDEVRFLHHWLLEHHEIAKLWPGSVIAQCVSDVLGDDVVSEEKLQHLKVILQQLIGGGIELTGAVDGLSTKLPIEDDVIVQWEERSFCFTGKFLYGARSVCERAVMERGGTSTGNVLKSLDYLVIGTLVSPDWINSTYGRKIEQAVANQASGSPTRIISEDRWAQFLDT